MVRLGLFPNMNDTEYFSLPYYSSSVIRAYERNPSLLTLSKSESTSQPFYKIEKEETRYQLFGTLMHRFLLDENPNEDTLDVLTRSERATFERCLSNARLNKTFNDILSLAVHVETPVIFSTSLGSLGITLSNSSSRKNGGVSLICKAKPDIVANIDGNMFLCDIKTSREPIEKYENVLKFFREDIQMAFYKTALETCNINISHVLVFVIEKQYPYQNHLFLLDNRLIQRGQLGDKYCRGFEDILKEMHLKPRERFEQPISFIRYGD